MKSRNKRNIFGIERHSLTQDLNYKNLKRKYRFKITKARCPWNNHEDLIVKKLIKINGTRNWSLIASEMRKINGSKLRTGKQCRERWHNHLNPNINKASWSEKEDKILLLKHLEHGNKWSEISKFLPGRTDNNIKNHFYSRLRKYIRKILRGFNKEKNWFKMYEIDHNKYNSDKVYQLIRKLNIPYALVSPQNILEIILKNEGRMGLDKMLKKSRYSFTIDKIVSFNFNQNVKRQIINGTVSLIISKEILNTNDGYINNNNEFKLHSLNQFLPFTENSYTLKNSCHPHLIDSTSVSPVTQNIYTNTSTKGLSKKQSFSQFNALNNSEECERNLGFGDMQSSCERNKFEYEKDSYKIISPLNLPNSSFGFPIFSTTNSSFNLNFENVINVNKEKEKNVIDDDDFVIREIPLGDSCCDKSTETFYHKNHNNTYKCDLKYQMNTLRGKAKNKNFKHKYTPTTNDNNDSNWNKIISYDLNQNKRHDEINKSQLIKSISKSKKKVVPNLDIESIRTSNTEKIFCQCVMNAYNKHQPLINRDSNVCECINNKCKNNDNCKDSIYTNEFNVNSGYLSPAIFKRELI